MHPFLPTIAVLSDMLPGALGLVATIVVSFVAIALVSSYYRFQNIVRQAESTPPGEMGATAIDLLRIQLSSHLAKCARLGASFSVSLIRVDAPGVVDARMLATFVEAVKKAARCDDITCLYDRQTVALLAEMQPEDSESTLARIVATAAGNCPDVDADLLRVGIASYPGHGSSGKDLVEVACEGLAQTDGERPIAMPEIVDEDAGEESEEGDVAGTENAEGQDSKGRKRRRRSAMLDELTGVLKPSAVSAYMQRAMNDYRRKRKSVSLFCIGLNNIDHITRFHGEGAADDVLVGVSRILQDNLRADDLIGRHEKYAFLVLAQASLDEAETIGKRIATLVRQGGMSSGAKKLKTTVTIGVAGHPEHGRNLHALYKSGQKVLDYSRSNDIRAYAVYDPEIHDGTPSKPMKSIKSVQA